MSPNQSETSPKKPYSIVDAVEEAEVVLDAIENDAYIALDISSGKTVIEPAPTKDGIERAKRFFSDFNRGSVTSLTIYFYLLHQAGFDFSSLESSAWFYTPLIIYNLLRGTVGLGFDAHQVLEKRRSQAMWHRNLLLTLKLATAPTPIQPSSTHEKLEEILTQSKAELLLEGFLHLLRVSAHSTTIVTAVLFLINSFSPELTVQSELWMVAVPFIIFTLSNGVVNNLNQRRKAKIRQFFTGYLETVDQRAKSKIKRNLEDTVENDIEDEYSDEFDDDEELEIEADE
jgi:hypothetical protein